MLKAQLTRYKKLAGGWWAVIIVVGAALILFLGQVPSPIQPAEPVPLTPSPSVAQPAVEEATEEGSFLDEYDPDDVSLLDTADPSGEERSSWEVSTDLFLKLALVLGLVYLAMLGLRWLQRQNHDQAGHGTTINVLETKGLAPGRSLHLVVVGEKTLLLGVTEQQISILTELADARVPLPEETTFDEALVSQQQPAETGLLTMLDSQDEAVEYSSDWQSTLNDLRTGIRKMQESVKGQ